MANTLKFGNGEWYGKKDTIFAYNDENDNYKPLLFDFSRASSATVLNKDGLIETVGSGQPRIDYKDDSKGALLLEPQRTNAMRYSSDFSQWSIKSNVTINSNVGLAPDGTLSADRIVFNGATNARVEDTAQGIDAFSYTNDRPISVWLKSESGTTTVQLGSSSSYLLTVTVTEEWQRFTYISKQGFARIRSDNATSVLAWGYQFETNGDVSLSYATSYIPTNGATSTRLADRAYKQNVTQVIGQSEGTMYIEFVPKDISTFQVLYQIRNSSGTPGQVDIRLQNGIINTIANDGGSSQFNMSGISYSAGTIYKVAVRYKLNDSKIYINGSSVGTDTSCSFTASSLDQVAFAEGLGSLLPIADISDARLYNTGLSDSELAALTQV